MSFIKKNYEKVLLGAVLLGLVGSLLGLPIIIQHDKEQLAAIENSIVNAPPKPLPDLDMSAEDAALSQVQSDYNLDLETTNRLFNPLEWDRTPDGRLIRGAEAGLGAIKVTNITPLHYILRLDRVEPANQFSAARYVISAEEQNAPEPFQRHPHQHYLSVGEKDEALSLISASGAATSQQLNLQILSSGETVSLTQSQPYQEVDGYTADLSYPPNPAESKSWKGLRVGADIKFSGNEYKVVVIDPNEVVISAESNQKKTTLPYQP